MIIRHYVLSHLGIRDSTLLYHDWTHCSNSPVSIGKIEGPWKCFVF